MVQGWFIAVSMDRSFAFIPKPFRPFFGSIGWQQYTRTTWRTGNRLSGQEGGQDDEYPVFCQIIPLRCLPYRSRSRVSTMTCMKYGHAPDSFFGLLLQKN